MGSGPRDGPFHESGNGAGEPPIRPVAAPYDPERRRVAAHIEWQKQGTWLVIWGPFNRRFWAFARWPLPPGGAVVSATDAEGLYTRMREVERRHGFLRWRYGR